MGFILDAIGAAANAGGDILAEQRKSDVQLTQQRTLQADAEQRSMRLSEFNKKLDVQKQQEVEKLKLEMMPQELAVKSDAEDSARKKRAKELGDAQTGLVKKAMVGKLDGFYADGKQRTVDSVSDDELNIPEVQLSEAEKSKALRQAGVETGQLSAKDAIGDESRSQIAQLRADVADAKTDAQRDIANAKLDAAIARIGASGRGRSEIDQFYGDERKGIATRADILHKRQKDEMDAAMTPAEKKAVIAAYKPKFEALDIEQEDLSKRLGDTNRKFPAESSGGKPKADKPKSSVASLPKGAVQIGTSGGKPVYQTPDGKKFIGN